MDREVREEDQGLKSSIQLNSRQRDDLEVIRRSARSLVGLTTMLYNHPSDEDLVRPVEELRC